MSGWFGQSKKRSPKPPGGGGGGVDALSSSGSVGSDDTATKSPGPAFGGVARLKGGGQDLYNPLAWDNMPLALQEKFPHWKDGSTPQSKSNSNSQSDQAYSCYKTTYNIKQQPDYTFPYVVMENDTLNSIAVKFETTPAELARLNKKPLGINSTIFSGEVLYVPDQDEIARSAPKSAPPQISRLSGSEQLQSSVDSEGTLRSSSVSHPPDHTLQSRGVAEKEAETGEMEGEPSSTSLQAPDEVFEEIAETHVVLRSRYISDDQGCAHGNLMINKTAIMFTPFPNEPLVKEHGSANFEVMIPLQDVTFAAFTRDINPPSSKKKARILVADERAGEEAEQPKTMMDDSLDHVREGEKETATNDEKESVASLSQAGVAGEDRGGTENEDKEDTTGVYKEGVAEEEKGSMAKDVSEEVLGGESEVRTGKDSEHDQLLSSGSHTFSPVHGSDGGISGSETERGTRGHPNHQPSCSSTDELLAIMGAEQPSQHSHPDHISQSTSESSGDNNILQLSENLCFLHLRVSHKSSAAHTYTPVNMAMGIDIPQNQPPRGFIQQVKSNFCFAVEERRMSDLVNFISKQHPYGVPCEVRSPVFSSSWSDGSFEFISHDDAAHEDLNFSDNHFMGAESSESWEICSLKDMPKYRRIIDKMEVEPELPLPALSEESDLIKESHLKALSPNLISAAIGHDWVLVYSTFKHGISLRTLYRNMLSCELPETAVVLLVRDDQNKLFGAALTARLRISEKFYGTGESFLFSFDSPSDLLIYPWTGENNYIIKGNADSIGIGCDDGHYGLWLDEYLLNGCSQECSTFANACLSSATEFTCTGVEVWGFR